MKNRKIPGVAAAFLLLLAVVVVLSCGAILLLPDDLPQAYPNNLPGNIMNQSRIAVGKDIVFYTSPAGGVYKLFGDTATKINDDQADFIYAADEGPVYCAGSQIYRTLHDGSYKTQIISQVRHPLVIGRWIYYVDQSEQLIKFRMDDQKIFELGIRPKNGKYYVSAGRLFYIGEDDLIYTAKSDGSKVEKLVELNTGVRDFMLRGNELFFISTSGDLGYTRLTSKPVVRSYGSVDRFNVIGTVLVYVKDDTLYSVEFDPSAANIQDMNPIKLAEGKISNLSVDDNYIYYFDQDNQLVRMLPDGSQKQIF